MARPALLPPFRGLDTGTQQSLGSYAEHPGAPSGARLLSGSILLAQHFPTCLGAPLIETPCDLLGPPGWAFAFVCLVDLIPLSSLH